MVLNDAIPFAFISVDPLSILMVVLGLGLVIFFHELGHFAVAKWCNVCVERFSIGLGRVLWSFKWGETEYAISLIPFGGYVKMLGQDDMDPSQLSSEEIAEDPRAYSAKSVPKRMAIISAGVIMNVITGALFYATAFGIGVQAAPSTVGSTLIGSPSWRAGLRPGDRITKINDREVTTFNHIRLAVALSSGDVTISGEHADGTKLGPLTVTPDEHGTRRVIGVTPASGVVLAPGVGGSVTLPGSPAAAAKPAFQPGDAIVGIGDVEINNYAGLQQALARSRSQTITMKVRREGSKSVEQIVVGPNAFRTLGLSMDIGEIAAVRDDSPAARAGFQAGDRITEVDGKKIGHDLNPLRLPDKFEADWRQRRTVEVKVRRKGAEKTLTVAFRKSDPPFYAWTEQPTAEGVPLSVPSLGIAYHMIPTVIKVQEGLPAGKAGIHPQDRLTSLTLTLPAGAPRDNLTKEGEDLVIKFGEKDKQGRERHNWAYAFWAMQTFATRDVILEYKNKDGTLKKVTMTPERAPDWFLPLRGIRLRPVVIEQQASSPVEALAMGFTEAKDSLANVYLTIASLFGGRLSMKELSGPVGIATAAYALAQRGFGELLLFLGFLSMNLAVLNFLPIPILDGGHMVFLMWEAVTRKKPSEKVIIGATYAGLLFLVGLMVFVLYLDIGRFFQ